ncbi:MAG TPA: hypothetical protein VM581_05260 [Magnetospirillaceae bacterium]|nr:hypothetical protein [Magnetospirillaceae bacterium]
MDSLLLLGFAAILVVGVLFLAGITALNRKRSGLDHAYYQKQWQTIEGFQKNGGAGLQLAIFEADKLLDSALKHRGFRGQTMGERLKDASRAFMDTEAVWRAHKLRNRLAHEQNVSLGSSQADQALRSFKAALKDLGAF